MNVKNVHHHYSYYHSKIWAAKYLDHLDASCLPFWLIKMQIPSFIPFSEDIPFYNLTKWVFWKMLLVPFEAVRHHLTRSSFLRRRSQICLSVFMQLFFSHIHKIHSLMTRDAPIRQPLMITGSYAAFRPVLLISGSGFMTPCKCSAAIGCLSLAEKNTKCILEYIFGSTDAYQ